ncbi:MAG TPA: coenzyme F420-0:L-glutamate ligase [Candidatus Saccharimonadales bacterium]|nr:coenzyme F420-0:L-glutamate ligase [Candidatus Saccharimonadales bacterium]
MQVIAYKTPKIQPHDDLYKILDDCLPKLEEKSVVIVTSKIVSLCEGNVIPDDGSISKKELVHREADYYLGDEYPTAYGHIITIKNNILILSAGVDESNTGGYFVLWPKKPMQSAQNIGAYLKKKYDIKELGVIITDSHMAALRWGVRGVGLGWNGFNPLKNYVDQPDIFDRPLHSTRSSILDGLATASVVLMGEGNEQTPLAVITDVPFVAFTDTAVSEEDIQDMNIDRNDDIYGPLLNSVTWKKGGSQ